MSDPNELLRKLDGSVGDVWWCGGEGTPAAEELFDDLHKQCKAGNLPDEWRATPREHQFLSLIDGAQGEMMGKLVDEREDQRERIAELEAEVARLREMLFEEVKHDVEADRPLPTRRAGDDEC